MWVLEWFVGEGWGTGCLNIQISQINTQVLYLPVCVVIQDPSSIAYQLIIRKRHTYP